MISTKDNIKKEALSLFAKKGYYGTSITDLGNAVGLTKSSLYAHFASKDELFLEVFKDVSEKHALLFQRLITEAKDMTIPNLLRYHFEEYILYFYRNMEVRVFSNISLFHVPPDLYNKLRDIYTGHENNYRNYLAEIFHNGMRQGIIKQGDPAAKVWSFRTKRDGVTAWISVSPELNEKSIQDFWDDFWFGVAAKRE